MDFFDFSRFCYSFYIKKLYYLKYYYLFYLRDSTRNVNKNKKCSNAVYCSQKERDIETEIKTDIEIIFWT